MIAEYARVYAVRPAGEETLAVRYGLCCPEEWLLKQGETPRHICQALERGFHDTNNENGRTWNQLKA